MTLHNFESAVRRIHDHLYANANIRTPEDLQEEISNIVLTVAWAHKKGILMPVSPAMQHKIKKGDKYVTAEVAFEIRDLFEQYKTLHGDRLTRVNIQLDANSIAFVRSELAPFDFRGSERDWLGDALEVFRSTAAKRLGGQFFTDQRVTELAVRLLEYEPDAHDFLDVCSGTGGFLIAAQKRATDLGHTGARQIRGIEVDPKLAHLANLTLTHFGSEEPRSVHSADSLTDESWSDALFHDIRPGSHQRLASNPPFGIKITIKDEKILKRYSLGHVWSKSTDGSWEQASRITARSPDILFLERNLQLANPKGGRVALVVPYQILSGPKLGYVREWLLRNTRIIAVVDLPDATFQPWTGTKTSLLVYEPRVTPLARWEPEDYPVFMAVAEEIGHDRRGLPVLDNQGGIRTDLPAIGDAYETWRRGGAIREHSDNSFVISAADITREADLRLNSSFYRPGTSGVRSSLVIGSETEKFSVVRLGDVVDRIFCPGRFKRRYVDPSAAGSVLFLGGTNITQLIPTNRKYLAPDDPHLEDMKVTPGWILVTRSGSTGIVSSVPEPWRGVAISEHVIRIVPRQGSPVSPEYVEVFLKSPLGQSLIAAGVFGSVIDEITPSHIADLPIPVPKDSAIMAAVTREQRLSNEARARSMDLALHSLDVLDSFHALHVDVGRESPILDVPLDNL